jgi:predicted MFS family arabinose efflux permease
MAAYPGLTAVTTNETLFLFTSVVGGTAWSLAGGALSNYLLEQIPEDDRPTHLAWYMLVTNLAVLAGSLLGPALARGLGLVPALVVIALGRVVSAVGIWKLGERPKDPL